MRLAETSKRIILKDSFPRDPCFPWANLEPLRLSHHSWFALKYAIGFSRLFEPQLLTADCSKHESSLSPPSSHREMGVFCCARTC